MGADNWAVCPRCFRRAQEAAKVKLDAAMASYGKVPLVEFDRLRQVADDAVPDKTDFRTFRENYEFYNDGEGTVEVTYRGACTVTKCELSKNFETTLDLEDA